MFSDLLKSLYWLNLWSKLEIYKQLFISGLWIKLQEYKKLEKLQLFKAENAQKWILFAYIENSDFFKNKDR